MNRTLLISNPRSGSSTFALAHGNYHGEITTIENETAKSQLPGCNTITDRVKMLSSKDDWTVKIFLVDCNIKDEEVKNCLQNLFKISQKQYYLKRNLVDQLISANTAYATGVYNYFSDVNKFACKINEKNVGLFDKIQKQDIDWILTDEQIYNWVSKTKWWEKYILENFKPNIINYSENFMKDMKLSSPISKLSDNITYNSSINICYNEEKIRKKLKEIIEST